MRNRMKKQTFFLMLLGILLLVGIDQGIKGLVFNHMSLNQSIPLISDFLSITYVQNTGAAFSILEGNIPFFVLLSFVALLILGYYVIQKKQVSKFEFFIYCLLGGGILGNLWDRLLHNFVIDYIDIRFGSYQFAIFNFADICIVIGTILLCIFFWKGETNGKSHNARTSKSTD